MFSVRCNYKTCCSYLSSSACESRPKLIVSNTWIISGDGRRISELLQWSERINRRGCLLRFDDAKRMEIVNQEVLKKNVHR